MNIIKQKPNDINLFDFLQTWVRGVKGNTTVVSAIYTNLAIFT